MPKRLDDVVYLLQTRTGCIANELNGLHYASGRDQPASFVLPFHNYWIRLTAMWTR